MYPNDKEEKYGHIISTCVQSPRIVSLIFKKKKRKFINFLIEFCLVAIYNIVYIIQYFPDVSLKKLILCYAFLMNNLMNFPFSIQHQAQRMQRFFH